MPRFKQAANIWIFCGINLVYFVLEVYFSQTINFTLGLKYSDKMSELDSTQALLDSTILTPDLVDSVAQDSEEEEVFFGQVSDKEKKKSTKNKRLVLAIFSLYL